MRRLRAAMLAAGSVATSIHEVPRDQVTKTRHRIACLLAGGYCVALVLGGVAEIVVAGGPMPAGGEAEQPGLLATLREYMSA